MTHHTDAERAEFEAWARGYGTWEVKRDDDVALGTTGYTDITLTVAWHAVQAARRAPAAPVPQGWKDVAELCAQMCDSRASSLVNGGQLAAANEARKCASVLRNPPDYWREKLQAAAPQSPEAAPVQLPEPAAWRYTDARGHYRYRGMRHGFAAEYPLLKPVALYTEQQVRELLAAHGIGKDKA